MKEKKNILIIASSIIILIIIFLSFWYNKHTPTKDQNRSEEQDHQKNNLKKNVEKDKSIKDLKDLKDLKEIGIEEIIDNKNIERNFFNLEGNKISLEDLQKPIIRNYFLDDEEIIISEAILEPIKVAADHKSPYELELGDISGIGDAFVLKSQDIDADLNKKLNRLIGYNKNLNIYNETGRFNLKFEGGNKLSVYFYPIVYKVKYRDKYYNLLKVNTGESNHKTKNGTVSVAKIYSDGIFEIRLEK